jgi:hypothetical protein
MAIEGTVHLPVFGAVKKKSALLFGGGGIGLIFVIYWVRQHRAAQTAAAASSANTTGAGGSVTDPAGNTCSAVNPATGYCPGTLEDQQALSGAGGDDSAYDTSDLDEGLTGAYYGAGGATQSTAPGPGNFADNAEWAQYVEAYITTTLGGDPATVGNAIGKYLTGQPVTPDQVTIVNEATAYGGQPPIAGAAGDPPGVNTTAGTTGTGTASAGATGTTTGTTTATGSTGTTTAAAGRLATPSGTRIEINGKTGVRIGWNAVAGASNYVAQCTLGGPTGATVSGPFTVTAPVANFGSLKTATKYTALIWPGNAADPGGPGSAQPHAQFSFTTT